MSEISLLRCPNCGANINVPPGATRAVCEYCGSIFVVDTDGGSATLRQSQQVAGATQTAPSTTDTTSGSVFVSGAKGCLAGCGTWFVLAVLLTTCMAGLGFDTASRGNNVSPATSLAMAAGLLFGVFAFYLAAFPARRKQLAERFRRGNSTGRRG